VRLEARILLVRGDVAKLRQRAEFLDELRHPALELRGVGSSTLYWNWVRLTRSSTVRSWDGLHVERDAVDLRQARLQPADHLGRARVALLERLQVDLDAPAVDRRVRPVDPDERGEARDPPGPGGSRARAPAAGPTSWRTTRSATPRRCRGSRRCPEPGRIPSG
jgi:hypothetical protein